MSDYTRIYDEASNKRWLMSSEDKVRECIVAYGLVAMSNTDFPDQVDFSDVYQLIEDDFTDENVELVSFWGDDVRDLIISDIKYAEDVFKKFMNVFTPSDLFYMVEARKEL